MAASSDIARWARGHAAAERRAGSLRRPPPPAVALKQALELWDLNPALFDSPPDASRRRDEARARAAWVRLRRRWRGHR